MGSRLPRDRRPLGTHTHTPLVVSPPPLPPPHPTHIHTRAHTSPSALPRPPPPPAPCAPPVSAFVTHGVFPNMSWVKFKSDAGQGAGPTNGFRYFWLSDSCPKTMRDVRGKAPFEIISLASPIAAALQI